MIESTLFTSTAGTATATLANTVENLENVVKTATTLAGVSLTSLASSGCQVAQAQDYFESLPQEELIKFLEQINNQEYFVEEKVRIHKK